jgi:hypothetical protein
MRLFIEAIPDLSCASLQSNHEAIMRVPSHQRTEPDWPEEADALEAELRRRGIPFEPIRW